MERITERLLEYVKHYTTSDGSVETVPSTERQRTFAEFLKAEIEEMGVKEVFIDEKSFLMAKIPANTDKELPVVGFIAHLDTAPDAAGENVKPQIHRNYDGGILKISDTVSVDPEVSTDLKLYKGHDIVTSDGTTLLGGDDKAGIAAIMTAVEYFVNNPEVPHGDICFAFTPDEEIGVGGGHFNVEAFGADFAYTVDGETMGEFNCETFNAAEVTVVVHGHNVHPGNAKGQMINAADIACEVATMMPALERPEYTEGYEGFFHLCEMKGDVEHSELVYILRDFYKENLEDKKVRFQAIADKVNEKYGAGVVELKIVDEYSNMKEAFEGKEEIIEIAKKAYAACDIDYILKPIRGGTDGSKLSFRGLPCPNIFTGGNNFHSVSEYVSVQAMKKASEVIIEIVESIAR